VALVPGSETKVFDPGDASTGSGGAELLDAGVVQRGGQWWMFLAGQAQGWGAYAESEDGINWSGRRMFAPPEMRMFDFCVRERGGASG